ncbi:MAG: 4-(cytidine 5'-diphospho)-2-C-methyl-D-erythritol kinase, partial [Methylocella sp.]
MPQTLTERAPAKINLTLHVAGRRADGFHTLESFVAFSRAGDMLRFTIGEPLSLSVAGPCAPATGRVEDNLVLRTAQNFAERFPTARL